MVKKMISRIFFNSQLPLKRKVKNTFAYFSRLRGAKLGWRKRFNKVYEFTPEYREPVARPMELAHKKVWSPFSSKINLDTLRVCANISGAVDPFFIPEEVYVADIEPTLNKVGDSGFLQNKSLYELLFPEGRFPKCYFHKINGRFYDRHLNQICFDRVKELSVSFCFPVVLKPNIESYGGAGVYFPSSASELLGFVSQLDNFVVQERINQHSFFEKFNGAGLNTIRAYIYRSVQDDRLHVVNVVLRMGVGGSLDNETAGGILTLIRQDGSLNGFAVDKYGKRFAVHPDSGFPFEGKVPQFSDLIELSKRIGERVFYSRIFGLDLCLDDKNKWRLIEVNTSGAAIRLAQYHGERFFREFTEEVMEFCKNNHWSLSYTA